MIFGSKEILCYTTWHTCHRPDMKIFSYKRTEIAKAWRLLISFPKTTMTKSILKYGTKETKTSRGLILHPMEQSEQMSLKQNQKNSHHSSILGP